MIRPLRNLLWGGLLAALGASPLAAQEQYMPDGVLKVCQDPNNLPFSNTKGEGFENQIAELLAGKLGWQVEYTSFPQRMGFIRNTLRFKLPGDNFRCDLVMGIPANYDQASPTRPYFRSSYALVVGDAGATQGIKSEAEFLALPKETLNGLRIGIYNRSPASPWMARNALVDQAQLYLTLNADPDQYPGEIIERDLAAGKIDAAIVWGPIAGFFAKRVTSRPLRVIPLASQPGMPLDFEIAMGVRHEDKAWKAKVQDLLDTHQDEIRAILRKYHVPLLDKDGKPLP